MILKSEESKLRGSSVKRQFQVFAALCIGIALWAELGYLLNKHLFQTYFGDFHLLLVIILIDLSGFLLLSFLVSRNYFFVFVKTTARDKLAGFILALSFALISIFVDYHVKFPVDMNVSFPESLLFYPVIGFCVEIVFHVLPLSLLLWMFSGLFRQINPTRILWLSIALVSLLEPIFQAVSGLSTKFPVWVPFWIGFHVLLINLAQLVIFKRYGFIWMYLFRLAYYFFWHVAWGYLRLQVLF